MLTKPLTLRHCWTIHNSDDGFIYFLVGALRIPGFPLLIDVRLLQSRTSAEVCHALRLFALKVSYSDRDREFTAAFFEKFLTHRRGIYHTV